MRVSVRSAQRTAVLLAALGGLAACGGGTTPTKSTTLCPDTAIMAQASDVAVFDPPTSTRAEDLVVRARIDDVETICRGTSSVTINTFVRFSAVQGPKGGNRAELPVFVTFTTGGRTVHDKKVERLQVSFRNQSAVSEIEELDRLRVASSQLRKDERAQVFVGFDLTAAQFRFNTRQVGG